MESVLFFIIFSGIWAVADAIFAPIFSSVLGISEGSSECIVGIILGAMRYRFLTAESKVLDAELASGNFSENSVLGKLNRIFKDYKGTTPEDLEAQLEDVLSRAVPVLEQNLSTIKLLAAVAPLLGLLGTVVGMIETFQSITLFGTGDPKLMAGGISLFY